MDGYSIGFGLGGLIVGGIASASAVLAWLHAKKTLAFEEKKWEESKNPDVKVRLSMPDFIKTMEINAVNKGIPPVNLKYIGFGVSDKKDPVMLIPPNHEMIRLPHKLERWDEHSVVLPKSLVASILKDDSQHDGLVELSAYFIDTIGEIYSSDVIAFNIDEYCANPPTAAELEAGDRSLRSLFGMCKASMDEIRKM